MKVLLVNPPHQRFYGTGSDAVPPGLLRVGQALWDADHDVEIYNADAGEEKTFPDRYWFREADAVFRKKYRSWWESRKIIKPILKAKPDVVGFYLYSSGIPYVEKIMAKIRKKLPGVRIIVGGPHVQQYGTKEVADLFDASCLGDGEKAIVEMVGKSSATIYGYSDTPAEKWPLIQEELFPRGDYGPLRHIVVGHRGKQGSLCESSGHLPSKGTAMRPKALIHEIAYRMCLGVKRFHFSGWTPLEHDEWVEKFHDGCPKGIRFTMDVHPAQVIFWNMKKMREIGCESIRLTIDGGSPKILSLLWNGCETTDIENAVIIARSEGIGVEAYMKVGCPGVGRQEYAKSLDFYRSLELDRIHLGYLIPHYGSKLYQIMFKAITSNMLLMDALLTGRYWYEGWARLWNVDDKLMDEVVNLNEGK